MTCLACTREVTLIGGLCGHCESAVASAVNDALEDVEFTGDVVDIFRHRDGYFHVRVEEGGEA